MAGTDASRELEAEGCCPSSDGSACRWTAPVAVKEAVLPFKRFRTKEGLIVDSVLGPEMRSTGEVMGIDRDFPHGVREEPGGRLRRHAARAAPCSSRSPTATSAPSSCPLLRLQQLGFSILATEGTAEILARNGIAARVVSKYCDDAASRGEPSIVDLINARRDRHVINTPSGGTARADGYEIRAAAVAADKPLFTTIAAARRGGGARSGAARAVRGAEPAGVRPRPGEGWSA